MWAGAFVIDANKTEAERMRSSFHAGIVAGRLVNFYSYRDTVLKYLFTRIHPKQKAIGTHEILIDVPADEDGSIGCKRAHNCDVTKEAGPHSGYTPACLEFMPLVPFLF